MPYPSILYLNTPQILRGSMGIVVFEVALLLFSKDGIHKCLSVGGIPKKVEILR